MTVHSFFAHWLKEIDIRRYGGDICIFPTIELWIFLDICTDF